MLCAYMGMYHDFAEAFSGLRVSIMRIRSLLGHNMNILLLTRLCAGLYDSRLKLHLHST